MKPQALRQMSIMIVGMGVISTSVFGAEDWLTEPERDFYAAFGVKAVIDGRSWNKPANPQLLVRAAQQSPPVLQGRIVAFSQTFDLMSYTPAEQAKLRKLLDPTEANRRMRVALGVGLFQALFLGRSEFDVARDVTNKTLKDVELVEVWDIETRHIIRVINARGDQIRHLSWISVEANRRLKKTRPASDVGLRLSVRPFRREKSICLEGIVGDRPVSQGVLVVDVNPEPTKGAWLAMNIASGIASEAIGLRFGEEALKVGTELATLQEILMNIPISDAFLLPDLAPGSRFAISLEAPPEVSLKIVSVAVFFMSAEGSFLVKEVEGLDIIKRAMMKHDGNW